MARVFLSHSSLDNAAAVAINGWLRDHGWDEVFVDFDPERGIAAGERWEEALNNAANRCEAVIFLVSRNWLASEWCSREFDLARRLSKRLFGVLIDDITVPELPGRFTATWQFTDLIAGDDHKAFPVITPPDGRSTQVTFSQSGLARLRNGLMKAGLDPKFFAWPPKKEPGRAPYRGLSPLDAVDAGIFFGREAPLIEALDALRGMAERAAPRLLVVQGASGAGKSSFLRAGLLPRLAREDRLFCPLPAIRPSRAVLTGDTGLVAALSVALEQSGLVRKKSDLRQIVQDRDALTSLLQSLAAKMRVPALRGEGPLRSPAIVIPVDQAEELFQAESAKESARFLELLRDLCATDRTTEDDPEPLRVIVLFTIRTDSYGPLQSAPPLAELRQTVFSLAPLPRGAFETVIEGPARRLNDAGGQKLLIEPALTAALLSDIEAYGGRDALPLLAFTLQRLFADQGGDGKLGLADYEASGRLTGAIEAAVAHAMTMAESDPEVPRDPDARLALLRRGLIPWLAGIDPATNTPRRKVARLSEIPDEARPLIRHLIEARLLSTDQAPGSDEPTIEPAHEALLRQWGVLAGWLAEDLGLLTTLEGVLSATRDWEANARSADWLAHTAGRLEDAERLLLRPDLVDVAADDDGRRRANIGDKFGPHEHAYLTACRAADNARRDRELDAARQAAAADRRALRNARWGLMVAVVLALIAGSAGVFAELQRRDALAARDAETRAATDAEDQRIAAQTAAVEAEHQRIAAETARIEAEHQRVIAETAANEAERQRQAAETAAAEAERQRLAAENAGIEAELQRIAADTAAAEAQSQRQAAVRAAHQAELQRLAAEDASVEASRQRLAAEISASLAETQAREALRNQRNTMIAMAQGRARQDPIGALMLALSAWPRDANDLFPNSSMAFSAVSEAIIQQAHPSTFINYFPPRDLFFGSSAASFSMNGTFVAVAHRFAFDTKVFLFDISNGTLVSNADLTVPFSIDRISFSTDEPKIILSGQDAQLYWDISHLAEAERLSIARETNSRTESSADSNINLFDLRNARLEHFQSHDFDQVHQIQLGEDETIIDVSFTHDRALIRSGALDFSLRNLTTGETIESAAPLHNPIFSANGAFVISFNAHPLMLIDAATGEIIADLEEEGGVREHLFSPDGSRLAIVNFNHSSTGEEFSTLTVLNMNTGQLILRISGGDIGEISSVIFSPDNARIAFTEFFGRAAGLHVLDISSFQAEALTARSGLYNSDFEISTANSIVLKSENDGFIALSLEGSAIQYFRVSDLLNERSNSIATSRIVDLALTPVIQILLMADNEGLTSIQDLETGLSLNENWVLKDERFSILSLSPDGLRFLSVAENDSLRLREIATGASIGDAMMENFRGRSSDTTRRNHAVFSANGAFILTWSTDGLVQVWDSSTGTAVAPSVQRQMPYLAEVALSSDGRLIVGASVWGEFWIWDWQRDEVLQTQQLWNAAEAGHLAIAFSRDGSRIATGVVAGSSLGDLRLWDAGTGFELATPRAIEFGVESLAFSPDGIRLITRSSDGTIGIWPAPASGNILQIACRFLPHVSGRPGASPERLAQELGLAGLSLPDNCDTYDPPLPPLTTTP